jgi:hypothetical protein
MTDGEWPHKELHVALGELLDRLTPKRSFFEKIRSEGGAIEFLVGWFFDGQSGDLLNCDLLARIAELKLDLLLDVYPSDSPSLNLHDLPDGTNGTS